MKLYIAGPMTGLPDFNYPAFFAAENELTKANHTPLNPARNKVEGATWLGYMRASLRQIADADGIALLPGWAASRGAVIEKRLADDLGLVVRHLEDWVTTR